MILVCWSSACMFPALSLMGGTMQPAAMLWQPAIIGALFVAGQLFTLLAVARGDVSVAAPVLGVKVLMVPAASGLLVDEELSTRIWIAAAIAGIGFVQTRDATVQRSRILASVSYALLAACSMTLFDLLIQRVGSRLGSRVFSANCLRLCGRLLAGIYAPGRSPDRSTAAGCHPTAGSRCFIHGGPSDWNDCHAGAVRRRNASQHCVLAAWPLGSSDDLDPRSPSQRIWFGAESPDDGNAPNRSRVDRCFCCDFSDLTMLLDRSPPIAA